MMRLALAALWAAVMGGLLGAYLYLEGFGDGLQEALKHEE